MFHDMMTPPRKGDALLIVCVVSPFVGARHDADMMQISHMQRQRADAQLSYVLLVPPSSQGYSSRTYHVSSLSSRRASVT